MALAYSMTPLIAMPYREFASIIAIGLAAGFASGILGIGGGVFVVPALVYMLGFSQHHAQGTTLALLCMPVGIAAALRYHQQGFGDWRVAGVLFCGFLIGGYWGAQIAVAAPEKVLRQVFALGMVALGLRMFFMR
jgi:uncharacterized membrane protein YfcA